MFKKIDRFLWYITPRIYLCRDVVLVRWMKYEWIIKRC